MLTKIFALWSTIIALLSMSAYAFMRDVCRWPNILISTVLVLSLAALCVPLFYRFIQGKDTEEQYLSHDDILYRLMQFCAAALACLAALMGSFQAALAIPIIAFALVLIYLIMPVAGARKQSFNWSLLVFLLMPTVLALVFSDATRHGGVITWLSCAFILGAGAVTWLIGRAMQKHDEQREITQRVKITPARPRFLGGHPRRVS